MEIKANLDSVLVGRILAGLVMAIGFITAIRAGADAQRDGFRIFLQQMITPLSFGCVLIILSEGLKHLRSRDRNQDDGDETP